MGSGILKILPPNKVSHNQFLYIFFHCGYSLEPCVGLLLWSLSIGPCPYCLFFVTNASIIDYRIASLAGSWRPILLVVGPVPCVLGTVATQMSPFVTGVTLNFA